MCRLFAQVGEVAGVARHWLVDSSNSIQKLSHMNPHGVGLAGFVSPHEAQIGKWAAPAFESAGFEHAASSLRAPSIIGHIRDASVGMGGVEAKNVHPFMGPTGIGAHNGFIADKFAIEGRLNADLRAKFVHGDTDSERYMALLEQNLDGARGNMPLAVERTLKQIGRSSEFESLNFVRTDPTGDVWALRAAPKGNTLVWREIPNGIRDARESPGLLLPHTATVDETLVRSAQAHTNAGSSHVIASEPLDGDAGWNAFSQGQLMRFGVDGSRQAFHIA